MLRRGGGGALASAGGSSLTPPADPGDNGKYAVASSGNLTYVTLIAANVGYTDTTAPAYGSTTVQGALDAAKARVTRGQCEAMNCGAVLT